MVSHIYLLLVVVISFVIFSGENGKEVITYIGGMFGRGELPLVSTEFVYYLKSYAIVLVLGIIGATPLFKGLIDKITKKSAFARAVNLLEIVVLVLLTVVVSAYLVDGSFNPFLYFRF